MSGKAELSPRTEAMRVAGKRVSTVAHPILETVCEPAQTRLLDAGTLRKYAGASVSNTEAAN